MIAGILVCPEVIPPSEWLPVVWCQTDSENGPVFDNLTHANKVLAHHLLAKGEKLLFKLLKRYLERIINQGNSGTRTAKLIEHGLSVN
jgi:hypothetical protein